MILNKINMLINNAFELIQKYENFKRNTCPELAFRERQEILDMLKVFEKELDDQTLTKIESSMSRFWRTALKHHFPTNPFAYCARLALNKHILRTWQQIGDDNPGLPDKIHDICVRFLRVEINSLKSTFLFISNKSMNKKIKKEISALKGTR